MVAMEHHLFDLTVAYSCEKFYHNLIVISHGNEMFFAFLLTNLSLKSKMDSYSY